MEVRKLDMLPVDLIRIKGDIYISYSYSYIPKQSSVQHRGDEETAF